MRVLAFFCFEGKGAERLCCFSRDVSEKSVAELFVFYEQEGGGTQRLGWFLAVECHDFVD